MGNKGASSNARECVSDCLCVRPLASFMSSLTKTVPPQMNTRFSTIDVRPSTVRHKARYPQVEQFTNPQKLERVTGPFPPNHQE
eukprot:5834354-Amphidinium_carterae.1